MIKIIICRKYSNKKINLNNLPEYSILNPDTNSDSHSIKSKGCRLNSLINEIIRIIKKK